MGKERFRTFKVYKEVDSVTHHSGDITSLKKLVGRIVAVTVPTDETNKSFAVEFAFCSPKDKFNKARGQELALQRLVDKSYAKEDVFVVFRDSSRTVSETLRDIIVNEFSDKITWLHGVTKENLL